jgi:hypothetical protein
MRHIYNEFCYKNKKEKNEKEFFELVYLCKKNLKNSYYNNVYDLSYDNLVRDEKENENLVVKNFIDLIMNEEIEKVREREEYKKFSKFNKENLKNKKKNNKLYNNSLISNHNLNSEDFII